MASKANSRPKSKASKALPRNKTGRPTRVRGGGKARSPARPVPAKAKPDPKPAPRPAPAPSTPDNPPTSANTNSGALQFIEVQVGQEPERFKLGVCVEHMVETESRILRALADTRLLGRSVAVKCAAAHVSRTTWYRVLSDPTFITRARAVYRHALESDRAAVMTALLASASVPTREGHQDRKLFFQLLGDLDEAGGRHKGEAEGGKDSVLKGMSDQELIETARELGLTVPAGVERRATSKPQSQEGT